MHQLLTRHSCLLLPYRPDAPSCTARTIHPPEVAQRHIPPIALPAVLIDPERTRKRTTDHAQGVLGGEALEEEEEVVVVVPLEDCSPRNCRNLRERECRSCRKTAGSVADRGRLCLRMGEQTQTPEGKTDCRRGLDLAGGLRTELMDVQGMASGFAVCTASDSWTRLKRLATAVRGRTELMDKDGRRRGDRLLATPRASGKSVDVGEALEAERADFETATRSEGRKLMVFRIDLRCGEMRQG